MLNIKKSVSCFVIRIARQIDTKVMHPSEEYCQNLLVKFYFIKGFNFLIHKLKQKNFGLGFVVVQNVRNPVWSLKPCHVLLKQPAENVFVFR